MSKIQMKKKLTTNNDNRYKVRQRKEILTRMIKALCVH